ncbi:hypothetical protein NMD14_07865 [Aeromonas veronii]
MGYVRNPAIPWLSSFTDLEWPKYQVLAELARKRVSVLAHVKEQVAKNHACIGG